MSRSGHRLFAHGVSDGFSLPAVIGFLAPLVLALLIGLVLSHHKPAQTLSQKSSQTAVVSSDAAPVGTQPTDSDIEAANAAVLAYCSSDLRQDTSCALIPGSDVAAPGFVETGLKESGQFDPNGATNQGLGLAKQSGSSWSVIWVGQGCIPKDVAAQNNVPGSLNICAS